MQRTKNHVVEILNLNDLNFQIFAPELLKMTALKSERAGYSFELNEDAIRAAKAHLDSSFDFFMKMIQAQSDKQRGIIKAHRTLGKASRILFGLAFKVEDDRLNRSRRKRRSDRSLSASTLDGGHDFESDHNQSASFTNSSVRDSSSNLRVFGSGQLNILGL